MYIIEYPHYTVAVNMEFELLLSKNYDTIVCLN